MRIEKLMELNVTTAAKKLQRLFAAFVLGGDDIRRSGATSIPDALQMVPGVEAARINRNDWVISVRRFGGTLWGTNAVNGVINIITKSADKTQGALVSVGARLGWRPISSLELSLDVQNLFDARHPEFLSKEGVTPEVPRIIYDKLAWMF